MTLGALKMHIVTLRLADRLEMMMVDGDELTVTNSGEFH
jgi:hypothetical protein